MSFKDAFSGEFSSFGRILLRFFPCVLWPYGIVIAAKCIDLLPRLIAAQRVFIDFGRGYWCNVEFSLFFFIEVDVVLVGIRSNRRVMV